MRLILVRHGQTDWNVERRLQGSTDKELNELGRKQAECLADLLKDEPLVAIYASPLKRATETARIIARPHGLSLQTAPCLMELDQGDLEGLTHQDLVTNHADLLKRWAENPGPVKMPGGESLQELQDRAWSCIQRLMAQHNQGSVAVVSHNLTILSIICKAIQLDLSCFRRLRQEPASVSILDLGERGITLVALNDTCHLKHSGIYSSHMPG